MQNLNKLHALIHEENGFRVVAGSMNRLLSVTQNEHSSAGDLVDAILQQVGLTERLLSLANAVGMRSSFTQSVSTVQGAALLLGTDHVRRIAVMLTAYEGIFRLAGNSKAWLREFQVALTASELARSLSSRPGFGFNEECATVTLLRGVSRILMACASPSDWQSFIGLAGASDKSLEGVSKDELGLSYASVSQSAASAWGLPQTIYERVGPVPRPVEKLGPGYSAWVRTVSACAYEVAETLFFKENVQHARLIRVMEDFKTVTPDTEASLLKLLRAAVTEAERTMEGLGLRPQDLRTELLPAELCPPTPAATPAAPPAPATSSAQAGPEAMGMAIAGALGEIAMAVTQGRSKPDIFRVAVEGLARGLGASRTALVLRRPERGAYLPVAAFGMPPALAKHLRFPDHYLPDAFSAVVSSARDFYAGELDKLASKLPQWYVSHFSAAQSFAIFPLSKDGQPIGFLYADWAHAAGPALPAGAHAAVGALKSQLAMVLQLP